MSAGTLLTIDQEGIGHRARARRSAASEETTRPVSVANYNMPNFIEDALRFKLGSIKGSKKGGFGPYATPPKRLRIFEFIVRDQEVGGSNPLAPTISFAINNSQACEEAWSAWS